MRLERSQRSRRNLLRAAFYAALFLWGLLASGILVGGCGMATTAIAGPKYDPTPNPSASGAPPFLPNYLPIADGVRWRPDKGILSYRVVSGADSDIPFVNIEGTVREGVEANAPCLNRALYPVTLRKAEEGEPVDVKIHITTRAEVNRIMDSHGGDTSMDYIGVTYTTVGPDGYLSGAEIWIDRSSLPPMMEDVAAHEFRHALGIRGHSDDTRDNGAPRVSLPLVITTRDSNTVATLYSYTTPSPGSRSAPYPAGGDYICGYPKP